ncbi:Hypothetical protein CINCED_3A007167 [Cinara cedri]|uniref:Uncharacterized protein n=1 Tax=Cinara cedri TaxID=506608 RepID=A0A5E4NGL4_9HEMI|nr:Hypothetical protein CINCED_3A007167 [Cinara cedri]
MNKANYLIRLEPNQIAQLTIQKENPIYVQSYSVSDKLPLSDSTVSPVLIEQD